MHALIVYCHPVPDSYTAALRDAVLRGLARAGHSTDVIDLHAEGFDPVMSPRERRDYYTPGVNAEPVADHLSRLKAADALIFVAPTWWYGPPALLKGWLDRVLVPHETFAVPAPRRPIERRLTNIRMLAVVTSLGCPWLWWLWIGQPGRRILLDGLGEIIDRRADRLWLALHEMDHANDRRRAGFLSKVEKRFAVLKK